MLIDTHSHWIPQGYADALDAYGATDATFAAMNAKRMQSAGRPDAPERRLDLRLDEMDATGIDTTVLSLPPPGVTFTDQALATRAAAVANDALLQAAQDHPGRFLVMANVPFPDTAAALAEVDRVAGERAVRGIAVMAAADGWTVDDPRVVEVYEAAAERGLPIWIHPSRRVYDVDWQDWGIISSMGQMVTSSLAAARLVLSGTLDRVPTLEVLLPHLGGVLPYLLQRYEDHGQGDAQQPLGAYLRTRFTYDTCSLHVPALHCAIETVGVDRLMLGSDYPFRGPLQRMLDHIAEGVPDAEARRLVHGATAARWFDPEGARTAVA